MDFLVGEEERERLLLRQVVRVPRRRRERSLDESPVEVVDRPGLSRGERRRRSRERERRDDEKLPQRRNDQSLLPRKFSGVTSTIAIACATTLSIPAATSPRRMTRFAASAKSETAKKRIPW